MEKWQKEQEKLKLKQKKEKDHQKTVSETVAPKSSEAAAAPAPGKFVTIDESVLSQQVRISYCVAFFVMFCAGDCDFHNR